MNITELRRLHQAAQEVIDTHSSRWDRERAAAEGAWKYGEDPDDGVHVRHAGVVVMGRLVHDSSSQWDWPVWEYMAAACNTVPELLDTLEKKP